MKQDYENSHDGKPVIISDRPLAPLASVLRQKKYHLGVQTSAEHLKLPSHEVQFAPLAVNKAVRGRKGTR